MRRGRDFDLPHRKNVSERLRTHLSLGPEPVDVAGNIGLGALASVIALADGRKVERVKCEE